LKQRRSRFASAILLCALFLYQGSLSGQSADNWSFAVSGDSRNCGDIVMPGIAEGVRADQAQFYWHLGDYRANYDFDQDLLADPEYRNKHLSIADYQRIEWQDFISQQIDPFGDIPVYLGIGNHELVPPKTRSDFIQQFADWLDSPTIRAQRLRDDPSDHKLRTYNHWIQGGVDFISLDNASYDQFDDAQVAWIERVLARDETDANVRSVVVGMHDALPDSISTGHGMNESAQMERSGRRVYQDLLAFRNKTKKYVYVLASHSHFLIEDVYNNVCHPKPESVLPGWIVGTAGAVRYRLPTNVAGAKQARTDVYGYLLGTVHPNGEIQFVFKEIKPGSIPRKVIERYGSKPVQACFEENKSTYAPDGPSCTVSVASGN
jgi:Calcineurin-like phosphoesterase